MEIFKEIEDYDGLYLISNYGNVLSYKQSKGNPLVKCKNERGYLFGNM